MKETMEIPLTQGQVAIIDAEDWPIVKDYNWCALWDGREKDIMPVQGVYKTEKLLPFVCTDL